MPASDRLFRCWPVITSYSIHYTKLYESGSSHEEIREAISYGVVKMNIDTDTQWAYWDGVRAFEAANHDYLQGQIGIV